MTKLDPEILAHREWIGFVQPTGLVVSAPALVRAGAILDRRDAEGQRLLRECVEERTFTGQKEPAPWLPDFRAFARQVLGWSFSPKGYAGTSESPIPPELEVPLPDYGETLRPDFAVREPDPQNGQPPWQLLARIIEPGQDFDRIVRGSGQLEASAHGRMERLLRQTGVPAGLLINGRTLRLVSAPRGESSGWMDFRVADMVQTSGRPISTALRLLLGQSRLLSLPRAQRLAALLEDSRKFQNEVSERLAEQVLHALYELLRGFQAAHDASGGKLLRQPLAEHPDEVYRALLTVILRLVFLLYAEERDMLPEDETFLCYYSLAGLYERLREDAALFPDTMDQRYGAFGLIATNTIGQGDTRATGLRWICQHGGEIFAVRKRYKWPGIVAVVVSVVHVMKGAFPAPKHLDDRKVETITAFLFHRGGHDDPARLVANAGKSFIGSYVLGMGFTFDDTDTKGVAMSLAELQRLIAKDPGNREVIFPFIGGEEVNTSPTHAHHRYVINFSEMSLEECRRRWPELTAIVEAKVKPQRMTDNRESYRRHWWQYAEKRAELYAAIAGLERVLVISQTSRTVAFAFLPGWMVYSHKLVVFPFHQSAAFPSLQSRLHDLWARFFGSTMKDDAVYTPSDCFETFPFPENWQTHPTLEAAGKAYYEFRAALMVRNDEGLTKTYNRFHDPDERDPEIVKLRDLHGEMDRAVLGAYGWSDIPTDCEFLLDYEIDEEEWGDKKKPWRYRWPDEVRDEVLARLLELNAERAKEEACSGAAAAKKLRGKSTTKPAPEARETGNLFD